MQSRVNPSLLRDPIVDQSVLAICIEEYRVRVAEILKRVELQHSILKMHLTLIAAIVSALVLYVTRTDIIRPHHLSFVLLLAPLPLFFLSWSHANHDFMICANATYLTAYTFPNLKRIIGPISVLRWEEHLGHERTRRMKQLPKGLMFGEEYFIFLFVPISCSLIAFILVAFQVHDYTTDKFWQCVLALYHLSFGSFNIWETEIKLLISLAVQIVLLVLNVHLMFYTVRARDAVRAAYGRIPSARSADAY